LIVVMLAAACSSDSSSSGPIGIDSLASAYTAYLCNATTRCGLIDSVATTLYNVAVGRLVVNTFDATLAANGIAYRQGTSEALRGLLHLLDAPSFTGVGASGLNFFDDPSVTLSAAQERDMLLVESLQQALDLLAGAGFLDAYANSLNVDDYLWGKVHYVIFNSFLDGDLNNTLIAGGGVFSLPPQPAAGFPPGYSTDGARFTVDVANFGLRPTTETDLSFGSGSNRRSVVEMGPNGPVRAQNVIPGGIDGVVGHPHYGDQVNTWLGNGYHDTLLTTADVVAAAASRNAFSRLPGCTEGAPGRCIPGKGSNATDCISEVFIDAPVTPTVIQKAKLTIVDGSGADFDGTANGSCAVHMVICINNNDPRIVSGAGTQCQPTNVDTFELKKPRPDSSRPEDQANAVTMLAALRTLGASTTTGDHHNVIDYTVPVATADKCVGTYVVIPLRNGVATKKLFKTKVTRDDGVKDLDLFSVTCAP